MTVRPPEDSPGSLSAIGNDEALRMEGFFAACGHWPDKVKIYETFVKLCSLITDKFIILSILFNT